MVSDHAIPFASVLTFFLSRKVISIFLVGLIVPSNDPNLLASTGDAAQSPFVIAANRAGIKVVASIINAVVLTSAWSAGNSGVLGASRTLYGLAREGHAPRIFLRVSRWGIPYVTILFFSLFITLGYMSLGKTASVVFGWFQDLISAAAFINWIIICMVYLRFYYGMKKQGISRDELPWKGPFQPYGAWIGLCSFAFILLTAGYATFIHGQWDTETFFSCYFNIPLILILYFGFKFTKKTKLVPLEEMPIRNFIQIYQENPEPPEKPVTGWKRLNILWS